MESRPGDASASARQTSHDEGTLATPGKKPRRPEVQTNSATPSTFQIPRGLPGWEKTRVNKPATTTPKLRVFKFSTPFVSFSPSSKSPKSVSGQSPAQSFPLTPQSLRTQPHVNHANTQYHSGDAGPPPPPRQIQDFENHEDIVMESPSTGRRGTKRKRTDQSRMSGDARRQLYFGARPTLAGRRLSSQSSLVGAGAGMGPPNNHGQASRGQSRPQPQAGLNDEQQSAVMEKVNSLLVLVEEMPEAMSAKLDATCKGLTQLVGGRVSAER